MASNIRSESGETDRLLALSDGVIAIVITLLVLDISVPTMPAGGSPLVILGLVFQQWQEFFGFVLSFLVIGWYWVLHRRAFIHIEKHERGVVFLNLLFLLFVAFVPYATSLFATYPNRVGVAFLSLELSITGFSLALLWIYASRKHLFEEGLASRAVQIQAARFLASPVMFLASIAIAVFDPALAILSWFLLIPINGGLESRFVESIQDSSSDPDSRAGGSD